MGVNAEAVCCSCRRVRQVSVAVALRARKHPGWRCRSCAARGRLVVTGWHDPATAVPCAAAGCHERFVGRSDKVACSARCSAQMRRDAAHFDGRRSETMLLAERLCAVDGRRIDPSAPLHSHHVFAAARGRHDVLVALCSGCHQLISGLARRKWDEGEYASLVALAEMQKTGRPCAAIVRIQR